MAAAAAPKALLFEEEEEEQEQQRYANISLNPQELVQLEGALQLFFHTHQISSIISYTEFCALAKKLVVLDKTTTTHTTTATPTTMDATSTTASSSPVSHLSREERLWHDLYCVAVPTLYNVTTTATAAAQHLCLVPLQKKNRCQEIRRLTEETISKGGVSKKRSKEAMQIILLHTTTNTTTTMEPKNNDHPKTTLPQKEEENKNQVALSLLKPTTTCSSLEERVRARAEKRETQLQKVEQAGTIHPRDEWVAVSDVLFSHANHVLRQRSKRIIMLPTKKQVVVTHKKCVLTFDNLVQVLMGGGGRSRSEITTILQGIQQTCPQWIGWEEPPLRNNKKREKKEMITTKTTTTTPVLSKRTTVWINTSNYKNVRAQLKGEDRPKNIAITKRIRAAAADENTSLQTSNKKHRVSPH